MRKYISASDYSSCDWLCTGIILRSPFYVKPPFYVKHASSVEPLISVKPPLSVKLPLSAQICALCGTIRHSAIFASGRVLAGDMFDGLVFEAFRTPGLVDVVKLLCGRRYQKWTELNDHLKLQASILCSVPLPKVFIVRRGIVVEEAHPSCRALPSPVCSSTWPSTMA